MFLIHFIASLFQFIVFFNLFSRSFSAAAQNPLVDVSTQTDSDPNGPGPNANTSDDSSTSASVPPLDTLSPNIEDARETLRTWSDATMNIFLSPSHSHNSIKPAAAQGNIILNSLAISTSDVNTAKSNILLVQNLFPPEHRTGRNPTTLGDYAEAALASVDLETATLWVRALFKANNL